MTPSWLSTSLWISLYAVLWSYMEVEIEGKDGGWAKNLPSKKFFLKLFLFCFLHFFCFCNVALAVIA